MTIRLNIDDSEAISIKNNAKTIEIRVNKENVSMIIVI